MIETHQLLSILGTACFSGNGVVCLARKHPTASLVDSRSVQPAGELELLLTNPTHRVVAPGRIKDPTSYRLSESAARLLFSLWKSGGPSLGRYRNDVALCRNARQPRIGYP